jgi:hypothetical protein
MPNRPRLFLLLPAALALGVVPRAPAQTALQDSPFVAGPGSVTAPENLASETLQLSGISVVGKKTFVSIYDVEKKHSRWLAVGDKVDGVEVVSCDVKGDKAVVRVAKELKTLTLRPATIDAAGANQMSMAATQPDLGLPTAPVAAAAAGAPLTQQAIDEREARMMVSDLLEIGQQQRKAYEEKKAALDAAAAKKDG